MKCCMTKAMNVPKLDKLVTVEWLRAGATIDGSGNVNQKLDANWVQCGREWAKVTTSGSREFVITDQLVEQISHQWIIRYSSRAIQYTTAMRLRMNGRKFNIAAPPINIDEKNQWIRIDTIEVADV